MAVTIKATEDAEFVMPKEKASEYTVGVYCTNCGTGKTRLRPMVALLACGTKVSTEKCPYCDCTGTLVVG
jgi:hypothetical protein